MAGARIKMQSSVGGEALFSDSATLIRKEREGGLLKINGGEAEKRGSERSKKTVCGFRTPREAEGSWGSFRCREMQSAHVEHAWHTGEWRET